MQRALLVLSLAVAAAPAGAAYLTSDDDVLLPDVDTLMGDAENSVEEFHTGAQSLRLEVKMRQEQGQQKLLLRKQALEANLTKLNARVADVRADNSKAHERIMALKNSTDAQQAQARRWRSANNFLRESLTALQAKIKAVREFLVDSVQASDLQGVQELMILRRSTTPTPTVENFLKVVNEQDIDNRKVSLLSTGRELGLRTRAQPSLKPADLEFKIKVPELSHDVQAVEDAESDGEAQMVGNFRALYEWGQGRLREVQAERGELAKREAQFLKLGEDLSPAIQHLKQVHHDLVKRVDSLRLFAVQANSNTEEAANKASELLVKATEGANAVRNHGKRLEQANVTNTAS